jgi:hypothetical protein
VATNRRTVGLPAAARIRARSTEAR